MKIFAPIDDVYGLVDLRAGSVARVAEELKRERLRIVIHLGDFQGERRRVLDLAGTLSLRHGERKCFCLNLLLANLLC